MRIAVAKSKKSVRWRTINITWSELVNKLQATHRTPETVREYRQMSKEDRERIKDSVGGFVGGSLTCGRRSNQTIESRSLITLDADDAKQGAWDDAKMLMDCAMLCYSTHSHTPEKPRLRFIVPLSREITPEEYPAVARKVAEYIGIEQMDPSTYEAARLMFNSSTPSDGEFEFHVQAGSPLDPDAVLRTYGLNKDAWRDVSLWPVSKKEDKVRAVSMKRAGIPTEKHGIVGLFCRAYDVYDVIREFLSDIYLETNREDRFTFSGGSSFGGAIVYNDGAYLYSNHSTDPCCGYSVNAYDLVRIHRYGELDADCEPDTPISKRPSAQAMNEWCSALPEVKAQMVSERSEEMVQDYSDLSEITDAAETAADDAEDDPNWVKDLTLNPKTGECDPTINNALLILMHDPALRGRFGYDDFAEQVRILGDLPWREKGSVKVGSKFSGWTDRDDAELRLYLERRWKYTSERCLQTAFTAAVNRRHFHPVKDYLKGLEWDGKERLDTLLIDYMEAEDNIFTRAATRKWFCGAVKRVLIPGCQFDQAVVLVGDQGLGKSSFARILSHGWSNDSEVDMQSKEGYAVLHGSWLIELAELSSIKRADNESVKTFLSKREDTYRPAYGRNVITVPRQCVFFGSTNEQEFLSDRSGSRRFWPIRVNKHLCQSKLSENVDQIWAEAKYRLAQGEKLFIDDPEVLRVWKESAEDFTVEDQLQQDILNYLDVPLPENWKDMSTELRRDYIAGDSLQERAIEGDQRTRICAAEIKNELRLEPYGRNGADYTLSRRISNIMNHLPGWRKAKGTMHFGPYSKQKGWVRAGSRDSDLYGKK